MTGCDSSNFQTAQDGRNCEPLHPQWLTDLSKVSGWNPDLDHRSKGPGFEFHLDLGSIILFFFCAIDLGPNYEFWIEDIINENGYLYCSLSKWL